MVQAAGHLLRVPVPVEQPVGGDGEKEERSPSPAVRVRDPGPETSEAVTTRHHRERVLPSSMQGLHCGQQHPKPSACLCREGEEEICGQELAPCLCKFNKHERPLVAPSPWHCSRSSATRLLESSPPSTHSAQLLDWSSSQASFLQPPF